MHKARYQGQEKIEYHTNYGTKSQNLLNSEHRVRFTYTGSLIVIATACYTSSLCNRQNSLTNVLLIYGGACGCIYTLRNVDVHQFHEVYGFSSQYRAVCRNSCFRNSNSSSFDGYQLLSLHCKGQSCIQGYILWKYNVPFLFVHVHNRTCDSN